MYFGFLSHVIIQVMEDKRKVSRWSDTIFAVFIVDFHFIQKVPYGY